MNQTVKDSTVVIEEVCRDVRSEVHREVDALRAQLDSSNLAFRNELGVKESQRPRSTAYHYDDAEGFNGEVKGQGYRVTEVEDGAGKGESEIYDRFSTMGLEFVRTSGIAESKCGTGGGATTG